MRSSWRRCRAARMRGTSGIPGAVLLFVAASWVFGELISAFNIIWSVEVLWRGGPLAFVCLTLFS
jgi:hypothetical protein